MQRSPIPLKVQQFDLFQTSPRGPDYRTLPLAVRQETVRLLACLLQAHQGRHPTVIPDREASDE